MNTEPVLPALTLAFAFLQPDAFEMSHGVNSSPLDNVSAPMS